MTRRLYAVRDLRANDIVGGVHVFPAEAVAVRFFGDICGDQGPNNMIAKHVEDFELISLAELDSTGDISDIGTYTVITGKAWKAAQAPQEG